MFFGAAAVGLLAVCSAHDKAVTKEFLQVDKSSRPMLTQ
jgi:hypothetical protein